MRLPLLTFFIFSALTITVTGCWDILSSWILPNTEWGLYSKGFFENALVEAHGAIIDLLVVGVVLYWFEHRKENLDKIRYHQELLADLRSYRASDSSFRALGAVKRLLALGIKKLHLSELSFVDLNIEGIELQNCELHAASFTNSRLSKVLIENCICDAAIFIGTKFEHVLMKGSSFKRAKFHHAVLKGMDLRSCYVEGADFKNAILRSSNFSQVDCRGVNFSGADLRSANFIGAKNLTLHMILVAANIKALKSDDPAIRAAVASV